MDFFFRLGLNFFSFWLICRFVLVVVIVWGWVGFVWFFFDFIFRVVYFVVIFNLISR